MDHILARQSISLCDFRAAGFAATQRLTLGKQLWSRSSVDAAVNTATAQKRAVRRIDDSIYLHLCDVISHNMERHNITHLSLLKHFFFIPFVILANADLSLRNEHIYFLNIFRRVIYA